MHRSWNEWNQVAECRTEVVKRTNNMNSTRLSCRGERRKWSSKWLSIPDCIKSTHSGLNTVFTHVGVSLFAIRHSGEGMGFLLSYDTWGVRSNALNSGISNPTEKRSYIQLEAWSAEWWESTPSLQEKGERGIGQRRKKKFPKSLNQNHFHFLLAES